MKTINKNTLAFKNDELKNCLDLLLNNGYRVFKSYFRENEKLTYFFYSKDDKLAYLQADYSGVQYSTMHKPCKDFGTGFGLCDSPMVNLDLSELDKGFIIFPHWAKGNTQNIIKFKDLKDYFDYNSKFNDKNFVEIIK
jgi:hypothetical protein